MIISHALEYVYIGIPRTASKSMNRWLMDHYQGEWHDYHHSWRVPEEAAAYTIFTIVRNPYERMVSGWFMLPWSDPNPPPVEPTEHFAELMRQNIPMKDGTAVTAGHNVPEAGMNQANFCRRAGVNLVLHFEELPACLTKLPFVDPDNIPPLPHKEERGTRPSGNFFSVFTGPEDEALFWEYAGEDFEAFGYQRYDTGGPKR